VGVLGKIQIPNQLDVVLKYSI